jgi:NTP pyrophosphatase (non-canonical NTP hydrolase)
MKTKSGIEELLAVMDTLRSPGGCPWDLEQNHQTLRYYAVEEAYELIDAIEAEDDHEMEEELGDLLLQVVFHCRLASERGAFNFEQVCRRVVGKLIHRHPHVFGANKLHDASAVLAQWEQIKRAEKQGTKHARPSALDGIPKHLPALLRAHELVKKARRAKLWALPAGQRRRQTRATISRELFALAAFCQQKGWNAEDLLRSETKRREGALRQQEQKTSAPRKPTKTSKRSR